MKKTIFFDMDGTLADFFSIENWLQLLMSEKTKPYDIAKPLLNMSILARYLNALQASGIEIGVISWGSKGANEEYLRRIEMSKKRWLKKHLPSVNWDYIYITSYGVPKQDIIHDIDGTAILFDDNENIRAQWEGENRICYDEKNILEILRDLTKNTFTT